MKFQLLIAEDDRDMAELLAGMAREVGFSVRTAATGQLALLAMNELLPDVLITDLRLPEPNGMGLLREARERDGNMPVVLITGYATVKDAVEGFKSGLHDLITKPFNIAHVQGVLQRLHGQLAHRRRSESLFAQLEQLRGEGAAPVATSRVTRELFAQVEEIAPLDIAVLIQGGSGTGKGVLARHIHQHSQRHEGPFFALNCAAVPENLIENELFGHEKGAFTGASSRKRGLLELADGGTLLLDEINSTSSDVQARLLQFIQERRFMRVGGERMLEVDVRLIAAANEDLATLVEQGRFRADLYYRLNVFPITLPTLAQRSEDIPALAEWFIAKYARQYNRPTRQLSAEAMGALCNYHWPGNIRELENIIQRAVVLARGETIYPAQLPAELQQSSGRAVAGLPVSPDASLAELESWWIGHMLQRCEGNKSEAARRLGIDVSTLHRKLR